MKYLWRGRLPPRVILGKTGRRTPFGEGEFTFVVSDILLPWIVLDPRDGAAKPAPAEENFVSKLLGLFKK